MSINKMQAKMMNRILKKNDDIEDDLLSTIRCNKNLNSFNKQSPKKSFISHKVDKSIVATPYEFIVNFTTQDNEDLYDKIKEKEMTIDEFNFVNNTKNETCQKMPIITLQDSPNFKGEDEKLEFVQISPIRSNNIESRDMSLFQSNEKEINPFNSNKKIENVINNYSKASEKGEENKKILKSPVRKNSVNYINKFSNVNNKYIDKKENLNNDVINRERSIKTKSRSQSKINNNSNSNIKSNSNSNSKSPRKNFNTNDHIKNTPNKLNSNNSKEIVKINSINIDTNNLKEKKIKLKNKIVIKNAIENNSEILPININDFDDIDDQFKSSMNIFKSNENFKNKEIPKTDKNEEIKINSSTNENINNQINVTKKIIRKKVSTKISGNKLKSIEEDKNMISVNNSINKKKINNSDIKKSLDESYNNLFQTIDNIEVNNDNLGKDINENKKIKKSNSQNKNNQKSSSKIKNNSISKNSSYKSNKEKQIKKITLLGSKTNTSDLSEINTNQSKSKNKNNSKEKSNLINNENKKLTIKEDLENTYKERFEDKLNKKNEEIYHLKIDNEIKNKVDEDKLNNNNNSPKVSQNKIEESSKKLHEENEIRNLILNNINHNKNSNIKIYNKNDEEEVKNIKTKKKSYIDYNIDYNNKEDNNLNINGNLINSREIRSEINSKEKKISMKTKSNRYNNNSEVYNSNGDDRNIKTTKSKESINRLKIENHNKKKSYNTKNTKNIVNIENNYDNYFYYNIEEEIKNKNSKSPRVKDNAKSFQTIKKLIKKNKFVPEYLAERVVETIITHNTTNS